MKEKLTLKLSDIKTGTEGLKKPKFILNTVKHDKPIIPKFILDGVKRQRQRYENFCKVNDIEPSPVISRVKEKK